MCALGQHSAVGSPFSKGLTTYVVFKCVVIHIRSLEKVGVAPQAQGDVIEMTDP